MIAEFNNKMEEDYTIKTAAALQSVIEKGNAAHKKNAKTVHDRNTAAVFLSEHDCRIIGILVDKDNLIYSLSAIDC